MTQGFAGVYFEKVLKGSSIDIWTRNILLASYSIILGTIPVLTNDYEAVKENGFFQYYNGWTFGAIGVQVFGGLLVSFVVKYADNILKTFATSCAIIVSVLLSVLLFGFSLTLQFGLGTVLVVLSVYVYSTNPIKINTSPDAARKHRSGSNIEKGESIPLVQNKVTHI